MLRAIFNCLMRLEYNRGRPVEVTFRLARDRPGQAYLVVSGRLLQRPGRVAARFGGTLSAASFNRTRDANNADAELLETLIKDALHEASMASISHTNAVGRG